MSLRRMLIEGRHVIGVWGLGYIGYSTLVNFAAKGVKCIGTDTNRRTVQVVNQGGLPVANLEYWLGFDPKPLVTAGLIRATEDWKELLNPEVGVHMIAVPTEKEDKPWDGALEDVAQKISKIEATHSNSPPLVIIESTLTPGKTDELVICALESAGLSVGEDIHVGVAPRRDWFISPEKTLKTLPRVVGGTTQETTRIMVDVLSIVCDHLVPARDHRHAELVKAIENAYRHVEITLANELSVAYPNFDMTEILKLVGTKWNIGTFHPSFGTGGYCLRGDEYIVAATGDNIRFTPIDRLYDAAKNARQGEVKVLSYLPDERRVCFRRVTAMSVRHSPTITLRTVGNRELTVTPEHIMYIQKKRKLWKSRAGNLKIGDEIPFLNNLPYFKFSTPYPNFLKMGRGRRGHLIDLEHFARGVEFRRRIGSGTQRLSTGQGNSRQTVPRFLKVNSELSFLLGLYAAEGCVTHDQRTMRTYLTLNKAESALRNRAKAILDSYALQYTEYDDKTSQAHQIRVSGQIWGNFISEMTGGRSDCAKLPEFLIFWHDRRVRIALLSGLLNGDGSFSRNGSIEFYTRSTILQQQAIYLLQSLGLSPTLKPQRNPPLIRLAGRKARDFAETVLIGNKHERLHEYLDSSKGKDERQKHEATHRPTLKKITLNGDETVYSMEVEGTQNFFTTSGWLVHNCIPLGSLYVLLGTNHPEALSILKSTLETDSKLPMIVADAISARGAKSVGILGLSYKADLKVHILSPTLKIVQRLKQRGVQVKVHDPYYSEGEIQEITHTDTFAFPEGMKEFDTILVVAGHRTYASTPETSILENLPMCRLVVDNVEEAWKHIDFSRMGIEYHAAGDKDWLLKQPPLKNQ